MTLFRACELAIRAIEDAYASLEERRKDGGMSYRVVDPATEEEVALVVPAGDESAQGAFCRRCLDAGLIFVLIDGAPARARCTCSASESWREKVAAYGDVFAPSLVPERPRYESEPNWSDSEPELDPVQGSLIPEMSDEAIRAAMSGRREY